LIAPAVAIVLGACGGSSAVPGRPQPAGDALRGAVDQLPAALARNEPVSGADVHFMTGMIAHHAQAVIMAGWAPSHGASAELRRLCERIVVGQRDEIAIMQAWLRERGQPVPDAETAAHGHAMPGMDHGALMPGMLTPAQMAELDAARGVEFDRLFLQYMIMHHEGALTMVDELFDSYGAAQDDVVFKFANDVFADQSSEITRMQSMLDARSGGG
jgi:uncharacterized protein (DUF305 family)